MSTCRNPAGVAPRLFVRCAVPASWREGNFMGNNKNVSKKEYEMLASFRYALRQFLHFSEQAAIAAGITPQQHQALLAIKGYPGRDCILVRELAERLQIRHHSAVELID